jgi:hypothetical protein
MWESDIFEKAVPKYRESDSLDNSLLVDPLDDKENMFLYSVKIKKLICK